MDIATAVQQLLEVIVQRTRHSTVVLLARPRLRVMCMSLTDVCDTLLTGPVQVEARRGEGAFTPSTLAIGVARIGAEDQQMVAAPLCDLKDVDFGPPLHSLVLPGDMHPLEQTMVQRLTTDTTAT